MATTTFKVTVTSEKPLLPKKTANAIAKIEAKIEAIAAVGLMLGNSPMGITGIDFTYEPAPTK